MSEEEEAIEKARALFETGIEIVYLAVEEPGRIVVEGELPNRPGTVVSARSVSEVRRFVRDLRLDRKRGTH